MAAEKYEVHEVHDWPERAAPGPRIVVWHGGSRAEAEQAYAPLTKRNTARFRYEVVPTNARYHVLCAAALAAGNGSEER